MNQKDQTQWCLPSSESLILEYWCIAVARGDFQPRISVHTFQGQHVLNLDEPAEEITPLDETSTGDLVAPIIKQRNKSTTRGRWWNFLWI
jgi:hypothetical protein